MAVLSLIQGADNEILRTQSSEVLKIGRKTKKLIKDMIDTMNDAQGLGIAAPQVGVNLRIFIARLNYGSTAEIIIPMINSVIMNRREELEDGEEGCLSLPGRFGIVKRAKELTVRFMNQKGQKQILHLTGLNARIIQHETDHIDGHLFIDRMEREILPEELRAARKKS